ncbi:MAG: dehydrogenase E1 component subunit alpha/beta [Spirochaetales bacterium]|jgi:2-oxoisovalerate dehydrogenase E1 component|nr:dehydrogenase E1 component subunit alpha/beta [Spirochaetales bacterium]
MAEKKELPSEGRCYRFIPGAEERGLKAETLRKMLFEIFLIRDFETRLLELKDLGLVHGPCHSSIGEEGGAVGSIMALEKDDIIASTHRGHHHFLAKAFTASLGFYDPLVSVPSGMAGILKTTLAEIMGLAQGYCKGRGGSMHLGNLDFGCLGTNAIVAGGVPIVTGVAWSLGINKSGNVGVSYLGDGATNQGCVHEVMNMAKLWKVPVIYYIENNLYAVATSTDEACSLKDLAQRAPAYGMEGMVVDGMDPVEVYLAMIEAKKIALAGTPVIIEAKTYRYKHQAQSLPGSAYGYRTKAEEEEWLARDAVVRFPETLMKQKVLTAEQARQLKEKSAALIAEAAASLVKGEGEKLFIPADLFPVREDLHTGIRSDGHEFVGQSWKEAGDFPSMTERTFIDVIPEVMDRIMEKDGNAIVLGEEVGHMKGGAYLATKGLFKKYRDRVIDTPISEGGFCGMALGLALSGKRPVVEIMFPDFALVAADQLFNQIGKCRYMYGNQFDVPLVMRTRVAIGTGYGAQHCMEPAAFYAQFAGWRIVAPSNPFDYIGLFNTAYRSLDPVLVIEHHNLYPLKGMVPADRDYCIPFGKARVARQGAQVTIVAWALMTVEALKAAETLAACGIDAEVIDLRTIDYAGIDYEAIGASLKKTGKIIIAEEGHYIGGIGAQLCDEVQRRFFDYLDAEIGRVAGLSVPTPVSKPMEDLVVPHAADIAATVKSMMGK